IIPSALALANVAVLRPTPSTLPTTPAERKAAANEPPINPTPTTASTGTKGCAGATEPWASVMAHRARLQALAKSGHFLRASQLKCATTRANHRLRQVAQ